MLWNNITVYLCSNELPKRSDLWFMKAPEQRWLSKEPFINY